jgi:hypothetical protein
MPAEPRVQLGGAPDLRLHLPAHVLPALVGQVEHDDLDRAFVGEEEGVAAPADREGIDQGLGRRDRRMALEDRPLPLEVGERGEDAGGHLLHTVGPLEPAARVHRQSTGVQVQRLGASHGDFQIHAADGGQQLTGPRRLAHDAEVGPVAAPGAGLGARLAGLLPHDAFQYHLSAQPHAGCLQATQHVEVGGERGLHVRRAPTVHDTVLDHRAERIAPPRRALAHLGDVDVAVEDHRAPPAAAPQDPHGVGTPDERLEHVDLHPEPAHVLGHPLLRRRLVVAGRVVRLEAHERGQEVDQSRLLRVHGLQGHRLERHG